MEAALWLQWIRISTELLPELNYHLPHQVHGKEIGLFLFHIKRIKHMTTPRLNIASTSTKRKARVMKSRYARPCSRSLLRTYCRYILVSMSVRLFFWRWRKGDLLRIRTPVDHLTLTGHPSVMDGALPLLEKLPSASNIYITSRERICTCLSEWGWRTKPCSRRYCPSSVTDLCTRCLITTSAAYFSFMIVGTRNAWPVWKSLSRSLSQSCVLNLFRCWIIPSCRVRGISSSVIPYFCTNGTVERLSSSSWPMMSL